MARRAERGRPPGARFLEAIEHQLAAVDFAAVDLGEAEFAEAPCARRRYQDASAIEALRQPFDTRREESAGDALAAPPT